MLLYSGTTLKILTIKHGTRRMPFFEMLREILVFVTLLINHCTSEVSYFQVQGRPFVISYELKINLLYFVK